VPRHVLEQVGGYDEELTRAEDYDLWLRISAAGFSASYVPGPLALYRLHGSHRSLSSDRLEMSRGESEVLRRLLAHHALPEPHVALAQSRLDQVGAAVTRLERGDHGQRSLRRRLVRRAERLVHEGTLYGPAPPEVLGAFPDLVAARPGSPTS
jgi:hypothetical protein